MMNSRRSRLERGFTLIEAIVTIIIVGILAGIVTVFIRSPIQGYVDSVGRAEVSDEADLALRRMARDLRLALPNSIRVIGTDGLAIELLLTKAGGRYLAAEDGQGGDNTQPILEFEYSNPSQPSSQFTVVGAMPSLSSRITNNDFVVVYNLGLIPSDAYQLYTPSVGKNIAPINGFTRDASGNITTISMSGNPFLTQDPPMPSPNQRFQVVSGPVTYYCGPKNGVLTLTRYWGYDISASPANPPTTGRSAVLATNVADCNGLFSYDANLKNRRSALVILKLALHARNDQDPMIRLVHQVHVDNTP